MCDTVCAVGGGGTIFAKNSDRPFDEPQVVEAHPCRPGLGSLGTQYLEIPDAPAGTVVGSRPTWLWGFEHGVNEHRVAIGNEKVWTVDDAHAAPPALIGMDLVRLGLERAPDADAALDVITSLLERHGQGGSGEEHHDEPYFSSFLIADPHGGWVLETSGRTWAARPVGAGAAISNRVTLRSDWTRASADVPAGCDFDAWRDPAAPTGVADHRLAATRAVLASGDQVTARDLVATMREHGTGPWGAPGSGAAGVVPPPTEVDAEWRGVTVCMHLRGYQSTTASMICELPSSPEAPLRVWTALGSPCAAVYVPAFPPSLPVELADPAQWARFAALRDRVEADGGTLDAIREVLAPVEDALWDEADELARDANPEQCAAFASRCWTPVDAALSRLGV